MCIELAREKKKEEGKNKKEKVMVSFPKILINSISKWNNFD